MNQIAPTPEPALRDIPLCRLALAPENVVRVAMHPADQVVAFSELAAAERTMDDFPDPSGNVVVDGQCRSHGSRPT